MADNRAENLAQAWHLVTERGLTDLASEPDQPHPTALKGRTTGSWATSAAVRAVMRANRGRDTRPERALRTAAHALGLRYRVSTRPLPQLRRTADLVFFRAKVAVFLDGCFWHGCPEHLRPAKINESFWITKITENQQRDQDTDHRLTEAGWTVIRVWEHEDPVDAAQRIASAVHLANSRPRSG